METRFEVEARIPRLAVGLCPDHPERATTDASEGQNGSPVWILDNGKRYMIGVLAAIGGDYNTVVHLRDTVLRDLRNWIGQTKASPSAREY